MVLHRQLEPRKMLRIVVVGGTFDHLHVGHQKLLNMAFQISKRVLIGLTTDEFVKKLHKPHKTGSYKLRERRIMDFLESCGLLSRSVIMPINNPFGITADEKDVDGIIVSRRTIPRARLINRVRKRRGLKPLQIITVDMVLAEDGKPISTTRIRRGKIDRKGHVKA